MWEDLNLSEDTKLMLDKLGERKREYDALKRQLAWFTAAFFAALLGTLAAVYSLALSRQGLDPFDVMSRMLDSRLVLLLGITAVCYAQFQTLNKNVKKKKEKYEKLRQETIERLYVPWTKGERSELKDTISKRMQSTYKVNLTFYS